MLLTMTKLIVEWEERGPTWGSDIGANEHPEFWAVHFSLVDGLGGDICPIDILLSAEVIECMHVHDCNYSLE